MQQFTLTGTADQIVPRIVLDLPAVGPPDLELSGDNEPIERHLVADLSVTYAFDLPNCFKILARHDLRRLALFESQIHNLAMRNLDQRMMKLEPEFLESDNGLFLLRTGGDFEATTILFDHVWHQAADMVRGEVVVSVPARDVVMFVAAGNRDGLAFMRSQTSCILERGDHIPTRHFLSRRDNAWVLYES